MVMVVAALSVHARNGFFAQGGGWELNAMYIATAVAIAFAGSGAFSLDRAFGFSALTDQTQVWIVLAVAVALGAFNLLGRRPAQNAT